MFLNQSNIYSAISGKVSQFCLLDEKAHYTVHRTVITSPLLNFSPFRPSTAFWLGMRGQFYMSMTKSHSLSILYLF